MKFKNSTKTIILVLLLILLSVYVFLQRQVINGLDESNSAIQEEANKMREIAVELQELKETEAANLRKLELEMIKLKEELKVCQQ